jgi:hypothetical protein
MNSLKFELSTGEDVSLSRLALVAHKSYAYKIIHLTDKPTLQNCGLRI